MPSDNDPKLPLAERAALVTGGGTGIGLASARELLIAGASVTLAGRRRDRLEAAADELRAVAPRGAEVAVVPCDVADEEQVQTAVETAAAPLGGLHLVVAAAGTGGIAPVVATDGKMLVGDEAIVADYHAQMPISRVGHPHDVAALVRFLCGPESSWITGES